MSSEDYYIYEEQEEVAYSSYMGIDLPLNISEGSHREQSKGKKSKGDRKKKITKQEKGVKEGRGKKNGSGGKGAVPVTGRPTNLHEEKVHMEENRSYTHIIYHYARFLIFFKLLPEAAPLPLDLPPAHSALLPLSQRALAADPFPLPHHPALFLLHPASLHSTLLFLREKFARIAYSSEEMKSLFLIFLESKQLLTQPILDYLNDYWNDIVFLVNHPQDGAADIQQQPQDYLADLGALQQGEIDDMGFLEEESPLAVPQKPAAEAGRKKLAPSEQELMRKEFSDDRSIIAYEIASYLYACCLKYALSITLSS